MNSATAVRKTKLEQELARYVTLLAAEESLQKALVFGSLFSGDIHAWSDIDLVIVQETDLPFWQRLRAMRRLLKPQVGTDILVYTPEEWEALKEKRPFFRQEILQKSRVIYERAK